MGRSSYTKSALKPKTYSKRLRSVTRSVRRKLGRKATPVKGVSTYKSLFPVK